MGLFLFWQALWILALYGYGDQVRRLLRIDRSSVNPAVVLLLGISGIVLLGGALLHTGIGNPTIWTAFLSLGALVALITIINRAVKVEDRKIKRSSILVCFSGTVVVGAIAIQNVLARSWNPCDDDPAYLYLARRIWILGDLSDSYNNRRLTSHGAGSLLQALSMGPNQDLTLHAFDEITGAALLIALLASMPSLRQKIWAFMIIGAVVLNHSILALANSSPNFVVMAMYAAALLPSSDVRWPSASPRQGPNGILLVTGVTLTLIRPTAGVVMLMYVLLRAIRPRQSFKTIISARSAGAAFVLVSIWAILQYRDCRTPFFPLIAGVANAKFPLGGAISEVPSLPSLWNSLREILNSQVGATALVIAFMSWKQTKAHGTSRSCVVWKDTRALLVVFLSFYVAISWSFRRTGPPSSFPRFWMPILLGILFALALAERYDGEENDKRTHLWPTAPLLAILVLVFQATPYSLFVTTKNDLLSLAQGHLNAQVTADRYSAARATYERVVDKIPSNSRLLIAVEFPHLLLDRRFKISTMDIATANAPNGDFPKNSNFGEKLNWLGKQGADYIILNTPNSKSCLYDRSSWDKNIGVANTYGDWTPFVTSWIRFAEKVIEKSALESRENLISAAVQEMSVAGDTAESSLFAPPGKWVIDGKFLQGGRSISFQYALDDQAYEDPAADGVDFVIQWSSSATEPMREAWRDSIVPAIDQPNEGWRRMNFIIPQSFNPSEDELQIVVEPRNNPSTDWAGITNLKIDYGSDRTDSGTSKFRSPTILEGDVAALRIPALLQTVR